MKLFKKGYEYVIKIDDNIPDELIGKSFKVTNDSQYVVFRVVNLNHMTDESEPLFKRVEIYPKQCQKL